MKDFGLLPDQLVLVNEFIDNVKAGKADLRPVPLTNYARQLEDQIQELKTELAVARAKVDALESVGPEAGGGARPDVPLALIDL